MQAALAAGVDGILAECGGSLMCATCHVYLDVGRLSDVGAPDEDERDMLEGAASPARAESRLACQIAVTPALGGLVVRLPEAQL